MRSCVNGKNTDKVTLLYGARTPKDLMYPSEYEAWQKAGIEVQATVDRGDESWTGRVGVVPMLFYHFRVDPRKTAVLTCGPEIMMRFVIYEALARRIPTEQIFVSLGTQHEMRAGLLRPLPAGPVLHLQGRPGLPVHPARIASLTWREVTNDAHPETHKAEVAVYKFSSCDGCQLSLLNLEDELLDLASAVDIAYFLEASSRIEAGPVRRRHRRRFHHHPHEAERIKEVRRRCKYPDHPRHLRHRRRHPGPAELGRSRGVSCRRVYATSGVHQLPVDVDSDRGARAGRFRAARLPHQSAPIDRSPGLAAARTPAREPRDTASAWTASGREPCALRCPWDACLGPVTHSGCGAICPSYDRGCYGCYGPASQSNLVSLSEQYFSTGIRQGELVPLLRNFNGYAPEFRAESNRLETRS